MKLFKFLKKLTMQKVNHLDNQIVTESWVK